jgi:hypothetical protein
MVPLVVISHLTKPDVDRVDVWLRFESGPTRAECVGTFAGLGHECAKFSRFVTECPPFSSMKPEQFRDFFLAHFQDFTDSNSAPCAPK